MRLNVAPYKSATGVPLPSFGRRTIPTTTLDASSPTTTPTMAPNEQEQQEGGSSFGGCDDDKKVLNDLTDSQRNSIVSFSSAVEMQIRRRRLEGIPLHTCYDLMDKTQGLSLPILAQDEKEWVTDKEMFLYKFLYVTTKARLYDIHFQQAPTLSGSAMSRRWYLRQCQPENGNVRGGINDVRAILFDPEKALGTRSALSMREAVLSLRPKVEASRQSHRVSPQSTTPSKPNDTQQQPVVPRLSTVEERVRAKRKARLLQEQQGQEKGNGKNNTKAPRTSLDETWRLRVADIVWTHSRKVWHRHEKFASPSRKGKMTPCSFVLMDVVNRVADQTADFGIKLKRRQVVELLQEICREVPEWIRRSSTKDDDKCSNWGRNDTLWIQPLDYKVVRQRLLGESSEVAPPLAPTSILGTSSKESKVARSFLSAKKANAVNIVETMMKKRPRKESHLDASPNTEFEDSQNSPHGKNVRTDDLVSTSRQQKSPVTKKRRLRVNPHLIISDADHQGGERIVPSRNDSPRGLKNLFHQLNSGRRI